MANEAALDLAIAALEGSGALDDIKSRVIRAVADAFGKDDLEALDAIQKVLVTGVDPWAEDASETLTEREIELAKRFVRGLRAGMAQFQKGPSFPR
ncbi:hypothetical protein HKCCSP123_06150 [Rhodobacterales bacterium HKCCSP123]|nr:hypothetical protein [Rhodobacterales bacterium HKCCSP123]